MQWLTFEPGFFKFFKCLVYFLVAGCAMALSQDQPWKHNRKRSLYVEAAAAGFIYRKSARVEKKDEPSPVEEEEAGSQNQPEHVSPDPPRTVVVDEGEENEASDEQLERLVEVKSFVDQLKRVVIAKGLCTADNKLEEVCAGMLKELKEEVISGSGPYMEFLEAMEEEEDKLPPHPMDAELTESIEQLQQKIELCERETREWETLMEAKKTEAQNTTQDLESDLGLDLRELGPDDEAKLASHLSPERLGWLQQATGKREDTAWHRQREEDLSAVSSRITGELERIQNYCNHVFKRCSEDAHRLGVAADMPTQTPRTLFRTLKDPSN